MLAVALRNAQIVAVRRTNIAPGVHFFAPVTAYAFAPEKPITPLGDHVLGVVSMGADEQMGWVCAAAIIAAMANQLSGWD